MENKAKPVLQKIGDGRKLTSEERKILKGFISVLQKALEEDVLSDDQRSLINTTIKKSKAGLLTGVEVIKLATELFKLINIFKDYS